MDIIFGMDIIDFLTIGIAIVAIWISIPAYFVSKKTLNHQALIEIHKEFRSPEMLYALDGVWKFYRDVKNKHKKKESKKFEKILIKEYKTKHIQERDKIAEGKLAAEESLNYKRRLVTHFYIHLASIHNNGILLPELIFDWWVPSDFKIFNEFIIPLAETASKLNKTPDEETKYALEPLLKLEVACKKYYDENKEEIIKKYDEYKNLLNKSIT